MSNHNEMAMQDAPAGLDTQYSFEPHSDGSYNAANNTFLAHLAPIWMLIGSGSNCKRGKSTQSM